MSMPRVCCETRELSSQLGVTENTVINWEVRDISPTEKNIERIKILLGFNSQNNRKKAKKFSELVKEAVKRHKEE